MSAPSFSLLRQYTFGELVVDYLLDEVSGQVGLRLHPADAAKKLVPPRVWLEDFENRQTAFSAPKSRARPVDSLVQVKYVGDDYPIGYGQGLSLRNGVSTLALRYERQKFDGKRVITFLRDDQGRRAEHRLCWEAGSTSVQIATAFFNDSPQPVCLEMLSSFSLGDITPFHPADAPRRLRVHRLRSAWSAEGRLHTQTIEELNLERSWGEHPVRCERFGQVGSLPVHGFFPFAAIEDVEAGVCWGAQLAWAGSWQMEFYRQGDALALSGGLADRELGHWTKTLAPGESFVAPTAAVACVVGNLDALCAALTQGQEAAADTHPAIEAALPIVCNEFCTTWGNPTHDNLEKLARCLQGSPVRYLVIDAGWYGNPSKKWWNAMGDWQASAQRFPNGIARSASMIRGYGLIPGLWFEFEVAGSDSAAFGLVEHQLKRDGMPITTSKRHFWDFRDPWVGDYLAKRVIALLREGGFGYAKFDYNDTVGIGCDGAESLGEGLRAHIEAVGGFYDRIRAELPELVIECCASGGHRLEPSMIARSAMSSFSDAHESLEIPIIAANLHRVMLPRQSQIWAVLRTGNDRQRLVYSLAATFLGRMCLSGDLHELNESQWSTVREAMYFYGRVAHIIKAGRSHRFGPTVASYRHPAGWQAMTRLSSDGSEILVVAHSFGNFQPPSIEIPLPVDGDWQVAEMFATNVERKAEIHHGRLHLPLANDFDAAVVLLRKNA